MSYLADSTFILADCSNFNRKTTENLFMNSRDRLRSNDMKKEIETELELLVKNHPGLRELKEKRRHEEIGEKLEDSKPLKEIIEDVIRKSPSLNSLFLAGHRINTPFNLTDVGTVKDFNGKEFPTYFKLVKEFSLERPKHCAINKKFRLNFETDANNDYFSRDTYPGNFEIDCLNQKMDGHSLNLWNGIATLTCSLPKDVKVGDILEYNVKCSDEYNMDPLNNRFHILTDVNRLKKAEKMGNISNHQVIKGKREKLLKV